MAGLNTARPTIAVVDYHKGNIRSVVRAFELLGAKTAVSDDADYIKRADAIVLPGVGAFTDAMVTLDELNLNDALRSSIDAGKHFLGICLGMHLLFEGGLEHAEGEEPTAGLGAICGVVEAMPRLNDRGETFKIPHVGWNRVCFKECCGQDQIFSGIDDGSFFYFTHSYIAPDTEASIATTTHSVGFPCAVRVGNTYGVQFHPEKSSDAGLELIGNFIDMVKGS